MYTSVGTLYYNSILDSDSGHPVSNFSRTRNQLDLDHDLFLKFRTDRPCTTDRRGVQTPKNDFS